MKQKKGYMFIFIVTVMLVLMIVLDVLLVFRMTSEQTRKTGKYQLESISGELESTINSAEKYTMRLALEAQDHLGDLDELKDFIYASKDELVEAGTSGYNIYIAAPDWDILPDLVNRDGFVATERNWYTGAVRNRGSAYVTPPYSDVVTGNICYTVSVMLPDGETVLGVDYTMENIQAHVAKMYETGLHNAVIVTEDGIIAGGSDSSLIGDTLGNRLPEYSAIFHLAKNSENFVTHRIKSGMIYENLFAARSGAGWYLIVSESDWDLYKDSYIQLIAIISLTLALIGVMMTLYVLSVRNRNKSEEMLRSRDAFLSALKSEAEMPLRCIMSGSDLQSYPSLDAVPDRMRSIHKAGESLSETMQKIVSFSENAQEEGKLNKKKKSAEGSKSLKMNKRFRGLILSLLITVMVMSLTATVFLSVNLARTEMKRDVDSYEACLSEWVYKQKSVLDMFTSIISNHPDMLNDYEGTVSYLDGIAKQYPEISAAYMTNPKLPHPVYMNNGWEPDENWHVEERQWYIDTLNSPDGWSISAPYFDEQTGLYCVTFSEQVHDSTTGEFLGNFGIDFYMDKLVDILGVSYSEDGYAFLADADGNIINHPFGRYQMTTEHTTNVSGLRYGELMPDGSSLLIIRDYDGVLRILTAKRSELCNFVVYKSSGFWKVYGRSFLLWGFCFVGIMVCIVLVYMILTRLILWYDNVNKAMREAADAATAAGNAKSFFLAQMSHEIRTPINAVLGMNEMILRKASDNEITGYAENIRDAGKTLLALINSILDFSKIEDGKMDIIPTDYDTVSLIQSLVHTVSARAEEKGLELIVNADPQLPSRLVGDDVRLTQIVLNLLTNAVKYTEHGTVTFSVSCKERTENELTLAVSVKDTGIGIRPEDMDKLSASFTRLDEKRNRNIEGTGLGIAIVTKLLKLMDSELSVVSVYGAGSEFSFELKQGIADGTPIGEDIERRSDSSARREHEEYSFSGARVLIVDDNSMNLRVAQNLLGLFGITADTAASGAGAIERMKQQHYHIVFLDHMMPEMDGIETLHRICGEKLTGADTAVIALTANAVAGAREMYLREGFADFLSKPIELSSLKKLLIKYLPEETVDTGGGEDIMEFSAEDDIEVMEFPAEEETVTSGGSSGSLLAALTSEGFSAQAGLDYCAGDEGFYREMLTEYADGAGERLSQLGKALDSGDADQYRIFVHSLKSISRTIGADRVAELALRQEQAAASLDLEQVRAHHEELAQLLNEAAAAIRSCI